MTSLMPPEEAVRRLASDSDDEEAWSALYAHFWSFVVSACFRALRGAAELAEDAAQEVFLRLARYRPFSDLRDAVAFRSYLYSMSQNVCRSYLRSVLTRPEVSLDEMLTMLPDAGSIDPEDALAAREVLDEILGQLDDADRQIIRLLADGYGLQEIQQALGIGYSDAGVRVHRLRRRLRNYLSSKSFDP